MLMFDAIITGIVAGMVAVVSFQIGLHLLGYEIVKRRP